MAKPRILVFASGGNNPDQGGSGFQTMVWDSRLDPPILRAEIVGVISNYEFGGVRTKAEKEGIPFEFFKGPYDDENYQKFIERFRPDFIMLSGWLRPFFGFPSHKTINIHPGPLPDFGGKGLYGHHVHEAVLKAFHEGKITQSAVTMHFVSCEYDKGPIFFKRPVHIELDDTPETLAKRVNEIERAWQSYILNLIVHRRIFLSTAGNVFHSNGSFIW